MSTIRLVIQGKPIAKKAPKFFRKGDHVGTYSAQYSEAGKAMLLISNQLKGKEPFTGALKYKAIYYLPIPNGTSKKKVAKMMSGELLHTKKPDTDNMTKFMKDCLTGLAWIDDRQVVYEDVRKLYSDNPRTVIEISELDRLTETEVVLK